MRSFRLLFMPPPYGGFLCYNITMSNHDATKEVFGQIFKDIFLKGWHIILMFFHRHPIEKGD